MFRSKKNKGNYPKGIKVTTGLTSPDSSIGQGSGHPCPDQPLSGPDFGRKPLSGPAGPDRGYPCPDPTLIRMDSSIGKFASDMPEIASVPIARYITHITRDRALGLSAKFTNESIRPRHCIGMMIVSEFMSFVMGEDPRSPRLGPIPT